MKLSVATLMRENAPSFYLRFRSVLELLRAKGEIGYDTLIKIYLGRYVRVLPCKNTDLVLITRIRDTEYLKRIFADAGKQGIPVLYETDDLTLYNRRNDTAINNLGEVSDYLRKANGIVTSTAYLAEELKEYNSRVSVFPNLLDPSIWDIRAGKRIADNKQVNICCIGTGIMPENLNLIVPAIEHCMKTYDRDVIFHLWGNEKYIDKGLRGLKNVRVISGKMPYTEYAKALQSSCFDFSAVPLKDSRFNRAKSNIKYLEYSASHIPSLFSKVKPYESLPDRQGCVLVENDYDSWTSQIVNMIEDQQLRTRLGDYAFKDVRDNYVLNDAWAGRYLAILEKYIDPV